MKKDRRYKEVAVFDAGKEIERIRSRRKACRKRKTWTGSKLDKHLAELLQLKNAGASLTEMRLWLCKKRVTAVRTTIMRFLRKQIREQTGKTKNG